MDKQQFKNFMATKLELQAALSQKAKKPYWEIVRYLKYTMWKGREQ